MSEDELMELQMETLSTIKRIKQRRTTVEFNSGLGFPNVGTNDYQGQRFSPSDWSNTSSASSAHMERTGQNIRSLSTR
ncbi:hypothetical protein J6590_108063, partial [Homalodisca vitripennis]